jgi:hypothetical protein
MDYRSGARKARLTSRDYLEMLDKELGFPQGAFYDLCVAAVKSKVEAKEGITVTYRGATERRKRLGAHKFLHLRKAVFLIEFRVVRAGKRYDRVVQVQLEDRFG